MLFINLSVFFLREVVLFFNVAPTELVMDNYYHDIAPDGVFS